MIEALPTEHHCRRKVQEILSTSRRAADLTRQLLAFGRKQMQALRILDLNRVLQDICRMPPRLIGEDIQLDFIPGPKLEKVKVDSVQIEQVVMNLAANARDAMPHGGKLVIDTANVELDGDYVVSHSMVPAGEYVQVIISDSGDGIPPEHLANIFEPFFTAKEEGLGAGLGLATVYGIIKQSGGSFGCTANWGLERPSRSVCRVLTPAETEALSLPVSRGAGHGNRDSPAGGRRGGGARAHQGISCHERIQRAGGHERRGAADYNSQLSSSHSPYDYGPGHAQNRRSAAAEQMAVERPQTKVLFVSGYAPKTLCYPRLCST